MNKQYVTKNLKKRVDQLDLDLLRGQVGGSGHVYSAEEIDMLRILANRAVLLVNGEITAYGDTPLHLAYCHGNKLMVDFLVEQDADPDARRYTGQTPVDLLPRKRVVLTVPLWRPTKKSTRRVAFK